nr:GIY-YIG nuclease family protein [uncultured Eubacterium sp.]
MNNYYVYRFINKNNKIVYVGRTTNLTRRYLNHPHLTDDIKRIEYVECKTAADMAWKEIYYINFFANEFTTNDADLYQGGVTDLHLNDEWKLYDRNASKYIFDKERIINNQKLITNPELISKIDLIHIIDHDKLNSIGKDKYALSKKWFYDENKNLLEKQGKHTTNYFHNICKAKSADCLWTTFDETKSLINGQFYVIYFIQQMTI